MERGKFRHMGALRNDQNYCKTRKIAISSVASEWMLLDGKQLLAKTPWSWAIRRKSLSFHSLALVLCESTSYQPKKCYKEKWALNERTNRGMDFDDIFHKSLSHIQQLCLKSLGNSLRKNYLDSKLPLCLQAFFSPFHSSFLEQFFVVVAIFWKSQIVAIQVLYISFSYAILLLFSW